MTRSAAEWRRQRRRGGRTSGGTGGYKTKRASRFPSMLKMSPFRSAAKWRGKDSDAGMNVRVTGNVPELRKKTMLKRLNWFGLTRAV